MKNQLEKEISELRQILLAEEQRQIESEKKTITDSKNDAPNTLEFRYKEIKEILEVIPLIKKKTNIIDEIVFKTQLLSFNASIEAERAGENGRGFSVVAQEIGNLAQTSGSAASDISDLIKSSLKKSQQLDLHLRNLLFHRSQKVTETHNLASDYFSIVRQKLEQIENLVGQMNHHENIHQSSLNRKAKPSVHSPSNEAFKNTEVTTYSQKDEFWPATTVNHRAGNDDPWEKIK